jgi:hypothetical protein
MHLYIVIQHYNWLRDHGSTVSGTHSESRRLRYRDMYPDVTTPPLACSVYVSSVVLMQQMVYGDRYMRARASG